MTEIVPVYERNGHRFKMLGVVDRDQYGELIKIQWSCDNSTQKTRKSFLDHSEKVGEVEV